MKLFRLKGSGKARNEQRKSIAIILRTIAFGFLGVGFWDPLSSRSWDGLLLSIPLALMSGVLFVLSLSVLSRLESEDD